ncbi:hypothetical protein GOP47_0024723 [Adiantum capillus-veneris]|uniref:Transcription factor-like protein DPB n=1 Tax=Adiantum capillus-veneris TaxID=13818 RepID=A0A9D4U3J0_ADICA|nr:hypothetical protein GOP47_0024723 [Adiantum capillus-veneris]
MVSSGVAYRSIRKVSDSSGSRPVSKAKQVIQVSHLNGRDHRLGQDGSSRLALDGRSVAAGLREPDFVHTVSNNYGAPMPGRSSQLAPNLSASMDSGSMDSPSLGSDSVMINAGTNSAELRNHNVESLGDDLESPDFAGRKKKRGSRSGPPGEKGGRGLRHFSMKVCEKVESKGRTTYNEVADELVAEFTSEDLIVSPDQQQYDEKNIRRRVYDALNVLMAMDIISKEKKEIQWRGLPSTEIDDIEPLKAENMQVRARIEEKAAYLKDLEEQIVGIQNLIERNERLYQDTGSVPGNGVALPFILVQTRPHATVEVEISEDMQLVHFDFNSTPFELHDDAYVLKAMKFGNSTNHTSPDASGQGLQSDYLTLMEEDNGSSLYQRHLQYGSPSASAAHYQLGCPPGKSSSSLPLPGILKARVKQETHT